MWDKEPDRPIAGSPPDRQRPPGGRRRHGVEQLSAGIYGTVVSSATMAAAGDKPLGTVVITVLTTVGVYWIAEEYARSLAQHAAVGRLTASDMGRGLRESFTMVQASVAPLVAVVVAAVLGAATTTAKNY